MLMAFGRPGILHFVTTSTIVRGNFAEAHAQHSSCVQQAFRYHNTVTIVYTEPVQSV